MDKKTKKYFVAVKQMQYFELEVREEDLPLDEDNETTHTLDITPEKTT